MVHGQNWAKINGQKLAFNPLRTVQGAILGYNSLRKRRKPATKCLKNPPKIGK